MPLFGPPNVEKSKAKRDVKGLIKALDYKRDEKVRVEAARALGEIGDPLAVGALTETCSDTHLSVRFEATKALGQIGDARAISNLIAFLGTENYRWKEYIEQVLVEVGEPAVETLINTFADKDGTSFLIKDSVQSILKRIGEPAIEPLKVAVESENGPVRTWALGTLGMWKMTRPGSIVDAMEGHRLEHPRVHHPSLMMLPIAGESLKNLAKMALEGHDSKLSLSEDADIRFYVEESEDCGGTLSDFPSDMRQSSRVWEIEHHYAHWMENRLTALGLWPWAYDTRLFHDTPMPGAFVVWTCAVRKSLKRRRRRKSTKAEPKSMVDAMLVLCVHNPDLNVTPAAGAALKTLARDALANFDSNLSLDRDAYVRFSLLGSGAPGPGLPPGVFDDLPANMRMGMHFLSGGKSLSQLENEAEDYLPSEMKKLMQQRGLALDAYELRSFKESPDPGVSFLWIAAVRKAVE